MTTLPLHTQVDKHSIHGISFEMYFSIRQNYQQALRDVEQAMTRASPVLYVRMTSAVSTDLVLTFLKIYVLIARTVTATLYTVEVA